MRFLCKKKICLLNKLSENCYICECFADSCQELKVDLTAPVDLTTHKESPLYLTSILRQFERINDSEGNRSLLIRSSSLNISIRKLELSYRLHATVSVDTLVSSTTSTIRQIILRYYLRRSETKSILYSRAGGLFFSFFGLFTKSSSFAE